MGMYCKHKDAWACVNPIRAVSKGIVPPVTIGERG